MDKIDRQSIILQLIDEHNVETQSGITELLKQKGMSVTQATVSRDIKELNLVKIMTSDGVYKYVQRNMDSVPFDSKVVTIFKEAVQSIDFAGNFICIHTLRGMANAAAVVIDSLKYEEILGSVAGDDTIFIMTRNPKKAQELVKYFRHLIKI